MRKFILALFLLLTVIFMISRFTEVQQIAETFQHGDWRFLVLAVAIELLWVFVVGLTFHSIYQVLGMDEEPFHMVHLAAAASFVNVVAPAAGVTGIAVFIADARKRGLSTGRVTVAGAIYLLVDYGGFLCILTLGLAVLARRNTLDWPEVSASIILLAIALGLLVLLYLAMRSAKLLARVLVWMTRQVNRMLRPILHREYLAEARATEFAHDAAAGIHALHGSPREIAKPFLLAVANKTLMVLILALVFIAFDVPFSIGTIIAGFSIGYLFLIVSPTPMGIGIVEGVLTLALSSLNVPLAAATVIVLAYRGITFWMLLLVGLIAFRRLANGKQIEKAEIN